MTPRAVAITLIWLGTVGLLGVLVYRLRRGAWSLEDEDIPPATGLQRLGAALALAVTAAGIALFIWDWS